MPIIQLWNKCNNKCVMCSNPEDFSAQKPDFSPGRLKRLLSAAGDANAIFIDDNAEDKIYITGGEPTMNPNFFPIMAMIHRKFPRHAISLLTNGRLFAYEDFTKKMLATKGIREIIVPLHGHNRNIHDAVTRVSGSFAQTTRGLDNIFKHRKKHIRIEIRVVINGVNWLYVEQILALIKKKYYTANSVPVIFMEFEGHAKINRKKAGLRYSDFKNKFGDMEKFFGNISGLRLYHFPLCVVPWKLWPYVWRTLPGHEVSFIKRCGYCSYKRYCLGIHSEYLSIFGASEFSPPNAHIKIIRGKTTCRPIAEVKK